MNDITNLISSVGFPIVACVFMYKQQIQLNGTINELSVTLKSIDNRMMELEKGDKRG